MMQLEDEDDPVVQEVDVYLCKQLLEKLYLLQYPVRPAHLPYDSVEHLNAKMKPKQQKLEMELAINTDSPNYAKSKGEQIAVNVDGAATGSEDQETFFATGMMDKQTLTSQAVNIDVDRYAVGFYKDGEFHLNPLTGIIQLRGSFSYLDKVDQRQKAEQEIESSQEEEEEAKPVMVKFARHETEEAKARRMASYEHLKKVQAEEAWINMRHHTKDQPMAEAERRLLTAQQSHEVSEFYISQDEYLGKLIPKWEEKATEKPALPSNVLSMTELKTMSLGDQVKALLINAKVIRFSQLLSLLPKGVDATAVLRCVQQVALLVQGCWVIKSDLLYPANSHSAVSGATAEALCRGRDYIMWRFTQHRHLTRKDIASVIKLHAEDVKDILEQMAFLRVNKGWEFLMATDSEFLHRHHEAAQRQHMIWDAKFHQIAKVLKVSPADMKQAAAASASPPRLRRRTTSRSRTKSGGGGFSDASDSESCGRERRLSGADRARHGSGASKRRHSSGTGNFENHSTALAMETDVDPHNSETLAEMKKELLVFVKEKLQTRYVLKLSELRTAFQFKLTELPAGHVLGKGVSDRMLASTVTEVGGVEISRNITRLTEPLFVNTVCGDGLDHIRGVVVGMLHNHQRVIQKTVRTMVEEKHGELPSEADVRKIVREYCASKGGGWQLKGT